MAHGHPDWGASSVMSTVYSLQDLAELAARLGSIVTFDRRGNVVWMDDFEHGLAKWYPTNVGTGASTALSVASARSGAYSAKLTGGSDSDRYARIIHRMGLAVPSSIGLEASFSLDWLAPDFQMRLLIYDGATLKTYGIQWDYSASALGYESADGVFTTFASGVMLLVDPRCYHTAKLVADMVAGKFGRLILDTETYDLTAYSPLSAASPVNPCLSLDLRMISAVGGNRYGHVDDVIVTQNEP
jgi:hypothetical protein